MITKGFTMKLQSKKWGTGSLLLVSPSPHVSNDWLNTWANVNPPFKGLWDVSSVTSCSLAPCLTVAAQKWCCCSDCCVIRRVWLGMMDRQQGVCRCVSTYGPPLLSLLRVSYKDCDHTGSGYSLPLTEHLVVFVLQWRERWFRRGPSPAGWTCI